jgi:hypothetical protein
MAQQRSSALEGLLSNFSTGTPGALQGVNSFLQNAETELGPLAAEGGSLPSFDEIFQNFEAGVEKRTDRQAAGLRESFGSKGARFGSDVLRAESDLRSGAARDIIAGAAPLQAAATQQFVARSGAEVERFNAGTNRQGALGSLALGASSQQQTIDENAFQRLMVDFIRQTAPPPLLEGLANFALGFGGPNGQPTTVI